MLSIMLSTFLPIDKIRNAPKQRVNVNRIFYELSKINELAVIVKEYLQEDINQLVIGKQIMKKTNKKTHYEHKYIPYKLIKDVKSTFDFSFNSYETPSVKVLSAQTSIKFNIGETRGQNKGGSIGGVIFPKWGEESENFWCNEP